jgi:mannan endo-1,4-beta-mannosidase
MAKANSEKSVSIDFRVSRSLFASLIITLLFILWSCFTSGALQEEETDTTPCNNNASDDAESVLQYIAALSSDDSGKAIVGQNCYHGDEITDSKPQNGYNNLVVELYNKTGKWVSIVGVDYEFMDIYSPAQLSHANEILISHWKKGGLVTINLSPLNPWVNNESGPTTTPREWNGPGSPMDRSYVNLKELMDPSSKVYRGWRKKLDRIADALAELQNEGVIVLWRPLQEMNGNWFWWGDDPSGYIEVYRDMFEYFTNEKKLNNLLWVYSPFGAIPDYRTYPGDEYIDIIAPTYYNDQLDVYNYNTLRSMGNPRKPFGIGEYGPESNGQPAKTGSLDTLNYIKKIKHDYPGAAYWVCWHSYPDVCWSLISSRNYRALMNDPDVLTVDKLNWKK